MTESEDLGAQLIDVIESSAPEITLDEVVARARRGSSPAHPRRARRALVMAVALAVLVTGTVIVVATRDTSRHAPAVVVAPTTIESTTGPTTSTTSVESTYAHAEPAGVMGVIGPGSGWMLNGIALYRTDDDGARWRDITPPAARGQDPIARIGTVDFVDPDHVWASVALNHAPFTVWRSVDGGTTWQKACASNACPGSAGFTFLDTERGWALSYDTRLNDETGSLYATKDGGTTWGFVGAAPFIGPMRFVNGLEGFGVTAPSGSDPTSGLTTNPGGKLWRTQDGGLTWQLAALPSLPGTNRTSISFGRPQFFGSEGVVVAWLESPATSGLHDEVAVYSTHDGGYSWTGRLAPNDPDADRYGNTPELFAPDFPFSASSPSDWMLFVGPNFYVTRDAGQTWSTVTTSPAIRDVQALVATSGSSAWGLAMVPVCDDPPTEALPCTLETLVHTTDGGRTWPAIYPH